MNKSRTAIKSTAMPDDAAIAVFAAHLRGDVIRRGDLGYDAARQVYNAMIDRCPALIVRCVDVADVAAAVSFARETGLTLAVRGGGHNGGGLGTCDDGLVIDLSLMKGIRVDPGGVHSAGRWRLHMGRSRPRHACLRPGHPQRHHLHNRSRRSDPGRRSWPSHARLRPGHRQRALGGYGSGRWPLRHRER